MKVLLLYLYMELHLFSKISQNEIWKFDQNLFLAKFGRERVQLDNTFPSTKFNGTTLWAKPPFVFFLIKEE